MAIVSSNTDHTLIQDYICSIHNITLLFYINRNPAFKEFMFKKGWGNNSEERIMLKLDGKNSIDHVGHSRKRKLL